MPGAMGTPSLQTGRAGFCQRRIASVFEWKLGSVDNTGLYMLPVQTAAAM